MTFDAKLLKGRTHGNRQVAKEAHVAFSSFGVRFLHRTAEVPSTPRDLHITFIYFDAYMVYKYDYLYQMTLSIMT